MKYSLAMILKNEEYYISKTIPSIRDRFDEVVAVDAESTDRTRDILKSMNAVIITRPWNNNYSDARNSAIQACSGDWILMLDGDEAMYREHVERLIALAQSTQYSCVALPRIEFVGDYSHYDPSLYPDYQCRYFRRSEGYRYKYAVHETLFRASDSVPAVKSPYCRKENISTIYHYGQCKEPREIWLRHHNYGLIQKGEVPLKECPANLCVGKRYGLSTFNGEHPLKQGNR